MEMSELSDGMVCFSNSGVKGLMKKLTLSLNAVHYIFSYAWLLDRFHVLCEKLKRSIQISLLFSRL